jgi:hypothetical protein
VISAVLTATPSVAFVATNAASSLDPALVVAGVVGLVAFGWQLRRHEPLWQAAAGLVVVGACAGVAALTGQARGFFLLPMLVPMVLIVIGVCSLAVRRPYLGSLLNRISGGPANWPDVSALRRIYAWITMVSIAFNIVSAAVQVSLYADNQTVALGAVHVITGPGNVAIAAATIVLVRRTRQTDPSMVAEPAT